MRICTLCRAAGLLLALLSLAAGRAGAAEYYGYDPGGSGFAPLDQITPGNVDQLAPAWTYHTRDLESRAPDVLKRSTFEVTPILVGDKLVACTPFNAVVAVDPGTGHELWRYDPEIKTDYRPANWFTCRGVAVWHGPRRHGRAVRRADPDRDRRSPRSTPSASRQNKQVIPDDLRPPLRPSGLRLGTPACTTRGMNENDMASIALWIVRTLRRPEDAKTIEAKRAEVRRTCREHPVPGLS